MSIWLVILLMIAIFTAWYIGYTTRKEHDAIQIANLPRDYFVGLNFLLNEEPDKAVDVFIKMLEVDSSTVETHLAVGNLFRRRGEVDRAIRIHQNLIARPQLDKRYREQSLYALGQDYSRAGMLDRAERVFLDLVNTKDYMIPALKALIDIYEQEKSWESAIKMATKLESAINKDMQPVIAQYYCELADAAIAKGQIEQANQQLKQALAADYNCVRASLLLAKLDMDKQDYKAAIKNLKRVKTQNPEYLSEAIDALASCYEKINEEEKLVEYLMQVLQEHPKIPVVLILSDRIRKWKGDKKAANFVADYVRRYPSISGLNLFINLYMSSVEGRAREDLLILQGLTKKLIDGKPDYQCVSCGFDGKILHWHCPGCKQWGSFKPAYSLV